MIKNENFYVVHGWMLNELQLKGNELLVYAIIYGFSQTENQRFTGSLNYLSEFTGATKQTVINAINSLISKGLIDKTERVYNGVKFCEYQSKFFGGSQNFLMGSQKIRQGVVKNFDGGSQKIRPNNIIYNIEEKKENKIVTSNSSNQKSKPKSKADYIPEWFEEVWRLYPRKEGKNAISKEAFKALSEAGKEAVASAIENYKRNLLENRTDKKYILMGSTFFNGRWEDYVREGETNGTGYASNPGLI